MRRSEKKLLLYVFILGGIGLILTFLIVILYMIRNHSRDIRYCEMRLHKLENSIDELQDQMKDCDNKLEIKDKNIVELQTMIKKIEEEKNEIIKKVIVTAYNSVPEQTDNTPFEAAWGDTLKEGMRIVAVSRDLEELGLTRGTVIFIEGLGEYKVLDRMHERKINQIDIYMGIDVDAARSFGVKNLEVKWINNDYKKNI